LEPETKLSLSARISALLRFLERILDSFWSYVLSLLSQLRTPLQKAIQSIQPQGNANAKTDNSKHEGLPRHSSAKSNVPQTDTAKKKSHCSSACFLRWGNFVVQILIFVAASFYGGVAFRQWHSQLDAMRIDQRAWVSVVGINTENGTVTDHTLKIDSVNIGIHNSGKTPAIKMGSVEFLSVTRPLSDPIPDYDIESKAINERLDERFESLKREKMESLKRQNPEMVEKYMAMEKKNEDEWKARMASAGKQFIQNSGVVAPGVTIILKFGQDYRWDLRTKDDVWMSGYILGKFTYHDVFDGTKLHTTKFCLMNAGATQFSICPQSNWMD